MKFAASNFKSDPRVIRIADGGSVTGILRGDPYEFEHAFRGEGKPKFRFKIEMIVNENGSLTVKILEGGWKLYQQLRTLNDSGWDLEKSFTRISRVGSGVNDTVYSANCLPAPPKPEVLSQVSILPKLDLTEKPEALNAGTLEERSFDDVPF